MNQLIFTLLLLLTMISCTSSKSYILHTEPPNPQVYQIPTLEKCKESGMVVNKNQMNIYYHNCEVFLKRPLTEKERKLWP